MAHGEGSPGLYGKWGGWRPPPPHHRSRKNLFGTKKAPSENFGRKIGTLGKTGRRSVGGGVGTLHGGAAPTHLQLGVSGIPVQIITHTEGPRWARATTGLPAFRAKSTSSLTAMKLAWWRCAWKRQRRFTAIRVVGWAGWEEVGGGREEEQLEGGGKPQLDLHLQAFHKKSHPHSLPLQWNVQYRTRRFQWGGVACTGDAL